MCGLASENSAGSCDGSAAMLSRSLTSRVTVWMGTCRRPQQHRSPVSARIYGPVCRTGCRDASQSGLLSVMSALHMLSLGTL